ncbi:MAG: hypothetical protein HZC24_00650 [Rhodocyclales bacterium]|nr:hypothetical protein [Rhodocyclales bacterium]
MTDDMHPSRRSFLAAGGGWGGLNAAKQLRLLAPQVDVSVQFDYRLDEKGVIVQTQSDDNERRAELTVQDFTRARHMYEDMFA